MAQLSEEFFDTNLIKNSKIFWYVELIKYSQMKPFILDVDRHIWQSLKFSMQFSFRLENKTGKIHVKAHLHCHLLCLRFMVSEDKSPKSKHVFTEELFHLNVILIMFHWKLQNFKNIAITQNAVLNSKFTAVQIIIQILIKMYGLILQSIHV